MVKYDETVVNTHTTLVTFITPILDNYIDSSDTEWYIKLCKRAIHCIFVIATISEKSDDRLCLLGKIFKYIQRLQIDDANSAIRKYVLKDEDANFNLTQKELKSSNKSLLKLMDFMIQNNKNIQLI